MKQSIFLAIVLLMLAACGDNTSNAPQTPTAVKVVVEPVRVGTPVYYDEYPATVTPLNQVELRPQVSGFITGIHFRDGDRVKKGQLLYSIDAQLYNANYQQALANLSVQEANLEKAEKDAARFRELAKHDAVAQQLVDNAEAALQVARKQRDAAKANISDSVLFHALGAWRITEGFHDVLWNPAFVVAASQLLGDRAVRFWHDQLFCKPAKHGGVVAWHQDYSYWTRTGPIQHLTCWVALDDSTVENGCLYYVPGSHNWGLLDKPELAGDMNGIMDYLTEEQKAAFKPVPIEMKAGYGTFHHPLLVHGSYENKSDRSRRAFVLNVFADGTKSNSDEEMLQGVPTVSKGDKMEGQFFPLLYEPAGA